MGLSLSDIIRRIEKLERAVFKTERTGGKTNPKPENNSLADRIIKLRDSGFFKQPKTTQETHSTLKSTYPCELNRVAVAMIRLHKKKRLRVISREIDGKKLKAYVWLLLCHTFDHPNRHEVGPKYSG